MPSINEAVRDEFAEQYLEDMKKEISSFISQNTWKTVPLSEANNFIASTWAFQTEEAT